MRAERFGSYSTAMTFPGTPVLFRLKSMIRYSRFWPPPRCRTVIFPWLLRPAFFFDLQLVRLAVHLERVLVEGTEHRALLRNERAHEHRVRMNRFRHYASSDADGLPAASTGRRGRRWLARSPPQRASMRRTAST